MRVLVTGAVGFIGSNLVEALLERGDEVVGFDNFDPYYDPQRKRQTAAELAQHPRGEHFQLIEGDLRDQASVSGAVGDHRPDAVVHLAGLAGVRASIGQALVYEAVNVMGSLHLLEACRSHGVERFVFASTSSVYGNTETIPFVETDPCDRPLAPYPATKRSVELHGHSYHNLHGLHFTALRFFTVYGPRNRPDMMASMLLDSITQGRSVKLFNGGEMWRDWTYVGDIARGLIAAIDRPLGFQVINMGRGTPVKLRDFVTALETLTGGKARWDDVPAPAADVLRTYSDIHRAQELLGYSPTTSLEDGTASLWRWYQSTDRA